MEQNMLRLIPKSDEHVTELRELYHTTKDVRLRTRSQIILLSFDGIPAPKIAKIVNLDPVSVRHHMVRYINEGITGLYDKPRAGRPAIVTTEYIQLALATIRRRPRALELPFSVWTLDRLGAYLKEKTGITISDETLRTHLYAHGASFSRPQHKISSPDPEYEQKKRRSRQREIH
jgi:transposase